MSFPVKPIYLLADSQLLFWTEPSGEPFLGRLKTELAKPEVKAAYVGASNGDQPEFFDLFKGAMASIDVEDCRLIPTEPSAEDLEYFDEADVVLLAGGDVRRGWRAFKKNGLKQKVVERYYGGAVLIGVSAGAVQLGTYGHDWDEETDKVKVFECFKLVPAVIDVHQEPDWPRMERYLLKAGEEARGLGIPSGGGAILHQDLTLEPVRRSLVEFAQDEDGVKQSLVFPPGESEGEPSPPAPLPEGEGSAGAEDEPAS
jgi:peptidase E